MEDGGGRSWKDGMGPHARLCIVQRMVTKLAQAFKADQHISLEKLHSIAANAEEDAFSKAQSQGDYLRRISLAMHSLNLNGERALQAAAENHMQQMEIAHQMQLSNPDEAIQGDHSMFTATPQAAPVMADTVWTPSQLPNQHMAGPNMQIRPSNMMAMANQNFNSQSATFAPVAWGLHSGQQIVQSIPMQSQNKRQAEQLQYTSFASCNPASMAQLQGQPVVGPNEQPNHSLQQNASGIYGVQQQPTHLIRNQHGLCVNQHHLLSVGQLQGQPVVGPNAQPNHLQQNTSGICGIQQQPRHLIRNQQGLEVKQHHTNSQWYQMVGANNMANMNIGYPGGLNCQQNIECTAGLQSSLEACEQEVLQKQIDMESQLVTPGYGKISINQQGNVYCSNPQTPEMAIRNEAVDWREEMFQQIELWKSAYLPELMELNRMVIIPKMTEEQLRSLPIEKAVTYIKNSKFKTSIIHILGFLHLQKSEISETHRLELPKYQTAIQQMLDCCRKLKTNKGQGSQDRHGKPQIINLTRDTPPDGKSQQNQQEQPEDASISETRQNVVATTPPAHQKTDCSDSQGVRSPFLAVKSPAGLQTTPETDAGVCCTPSPISKSGAVQVASPYGSLNSALQSPVAQCGVVVGVSPCASGMSSLTWTADEPTILAAASPCFSVKSKLVSIVVESGVLPVASPCDSVKSTARDDISNCHQVTSSELIVAASAQAPASQTDDEVGGKAETPMVKKPIERLLDAVRAASPAVFRSSVNSIKWALLEMDSVPLAPWSGFGSSSRMKRDFDVISSYSEDCPTAAGSSGVSTGAAYAGEEDGCAKRQKTQVPGPVTN